MSSSCALAESAAAAAAATTAQAIGVRLDVASEAASDAPLAPLRSLLTSLASRCHAHLLLLYATPAGLRDLHRLVQRTEAVYARLHWAWHHVHQRSAESWTREHVEECVRAVEEGMQGESESDADAHERGENALRTLESLCTLAHSQLQSTSIADDLASSMAYCAYYCSQYEYDQTRMARVLKAEAEAAAAAAAAKAEAEAAAAAKAAAAANGGDQSTDADSDSDSDEEPCTAPRPRGHVAPPAPPMRCCHEGGSCYLQAPMPRPADLVPPAAPPATTTTTATTTASATTMPPDFNARGLCADAYYPPMLLWAHSVFLLRMLFAFLFDEQRLLPVPPAEVQNDGSESDVAAASSDRLPCLDPSLPFPSLTRLCLTFQSWPVGLQAAVHAFEDNLQYSGYARMLVCLRGRGAGEPQATTKAAAAAASDGSATATAASALGSSPPAAAAAAASACPPIDGRVWKRVMEVLKRKVRSDGCVHSPELQRQCASMLSTAPGPSMLLSQTGAPPPQPLFLLGDSHSLTLHSQWLFLFHERRQTCLWMQMRTFLIVGLKAWHVGLVAGRDNEEKDTPTPAPAPAPAPARALPVQHQSSMLQRYARLIPAGSTVLLVAGEIDCRSDEGIPTAVAKGKYPDVRSALQSTVSAFLRGALRLARRHRWARVMVHPVVPPFLRGNVQRVAKRGWKDMDKVAARGQLIAEFNAELQRQIASMPEAGEKTDPPFHFLDFYMDLLNGSGNGARPPGQAQRLLLHADYTLEGMHLNVKYLPCIEREMEKIMDADQAGADEPESTAAQSLDACVSALALVDN